jgi:hypothetical protein
MTIRSHSRAMTILKVGMLAGLAGGAAEIIWVAAYGAVTGAPIALVARGVTTSLFPASAASPSAVWLGITLHMAIAVVLGVALAAALYSPLLRMIEAQAKAFLVVVSLGTVWAVNFLLILPHLSPSFVHLLPYGVTLTSKLLFGISAAAVLRGRALRMPR